MKTLSVQQPWASLICSGIKDIENRSWKPKEVPGRILIHAGGKKVPKDYDTKYLLAEDVSTISNLKLFGICPEYDDMPLSAIIGYVDVLGFVDDSDSFWANPGSIHWQLKDAYLFDEPIRNVKGKLGLFNYPLDENNLPPAHKVEHHFPVLENEHLTVHLSDKAWKQLQEDDTAFFMDINDPYVINNICKEESFELKPVKEITFINGFNQTTRKVTDYGWDAFKDPEGNDLKYPIDDEGNESLWVYAIYTLEK